MKDSIEVDLNSGMYTLKDMSLIPYIIISDAFVTIFREHANIRPFFPVISLEYKTLFYKGCN